MKIFEFSNMQLLFNRVNGDTDIKAQELGFCFISEYKIDITSKTHRKYYSLDHIRIGQLYKKLSFT